MDHHVILHTTCINPLPPMLLPTWEWDPEDLTPPQAYYLLSDIGRFRYDVVLSRNIIEC